MGYHNRRDTPTILHVTNPDPRDALRTAIGEEEKGEEKGVRNHFPLTRQRREQAMKERDARVRLLLKEALTLLED